MSEKKGRGVRYTPEQKQEVLDFVKANPGRGSMKQAQEKFGISYVAIRNWMENAGEGLSRTRTPKGEKKERKSLRAPVNDARFEKAKKLIDKIRDTEAELRELYADLNEVLKP